MRFVMDTKSFVDLTLWPMPTDPEISNTIEYEYRLAYVIEGNCVLLYEGKNDKDGWKYLDGRQESYCFMSPDRLLDTFWDEGKNQERQASGGPNKPEPWLFRDSEELMEKDVTIEVVGRDDITKRIVKFLKTDELKGNYIFFEHDVLKKGTLNEPKYNKILNELIGAGPVNIEKTAKSYIKSDMIALWHADILEKKDEDTYFFPYDTVKPPGILLLPVS